MNIKKMLKDGAKQVLPDEKIKQNIMYGAGIDGCEEETDLGGAKAKKFSGRKTAAVAAAGTVCAAAIVCAFIPLMKNSTTPVIPPDGIFGELTGADEVYGFSAASAGMMITGAKQTAYSGARTLSSARGRVEDTETIELINGYMGLVESLISGDGFTVKGGTNSGGAYGGYKYVMQVSYTDMLGKTRGGGTIYYNRELEHEEVDDDETESVYTLDGVMILDGTEYPLYGTHHSESEEDESEDEYTMRVTLSSTSYMLVEQEHEAEEDESETEYSYTVYEGTREISRTTFSYEREEDETELEMVLEEDGKKQAFYFGNEDGEITIRVDGSGKEVTYIVRIVRGEYVYFRDGSEVDREDRDDD